jgi:serine/threonine protein kinase
LPVALQTAHQLGTVHRDVKPATIMATDYGEPT